MGYLINAWRDTQKRFTMSLKQVVNNAGDGTLENEESIDELRLFFSMIDLDTMERLLSECFSKDKKYKFDTRGFAFQDLINEMGRRLGYKVENGLYKGRINEIGFDGLWKSNNGKYIIMESKTSDDYSIAMQSITGYRDKLIIDHKVPKKNCSILIVYGRDDRSALRNTVKGSDEAKNIRLISATALFQLVRINTESKSKTVLNQIQSVLLPKDYFVLDNLVELVFPQTDSTIPDIDYSDDEEQMLADGDDGIKPKEKGSVKEEEQGIAAEEISSSDKAEADDLANLIAKIAQGKYMKKPAIDFLRRKGISIGENVSYSSKQEKTDEYWANPILDYLKKEWWIILNNTDTRELIVLKVPQNTLALAEDNSSGLFVRADNPKKMNLNIKVASLNDRKSHIDFSSFVIDRIKY